LSARKASRRHATRATAAAKSPKTRRSTNSAALEDPLEYLLAMMNDERLTRMQREAIARKIAPYFHRKPKPVAADTFAFIDTENPAEDEAESIAAERQRMRSKLFKGFD